jgi:hypothetical protein
MAHKRIYSFGDVKAEGNKDMKELLGGKGAGLAEMSNVGIPVPPGFTITTDVCSEYYRSGKKLPRGLDAEVRAALKKLARTQNPRFARDSYRRFVAMFGDVVLGMKHRCTLTHIWLRYVLSGLVVGVIGWLGYAHVLEPQALITLLGAVVGSLFVQRGRRRE